jgi:7-cyano-7-deazaguanine synthase in queuosine biosynthesis
MGEKAVLLNSGGMDSRLVAHKYHGMGWELHSLHLPLTETNRAASREAAEATAQLYCVSHYVTRTPDEWLCRDLSPGHNVTGYPHTVFYSHMVAAQYAAFLGTIYVVTGIQLDAFTDGVLESYTNAMKHSRLTPAPVYIAPYIGGGRDKDLEEYLANGGSMSDTQSCHFSPICGHCYKCTLRKRLGIDR